ncbi:MAG: hypothetical protein C4545_04415 [Anaerolineaceae bacterium]|nr:MAG: hypothetical protein C4545_04415 [Anaerolineaceae bacterium]
MLRCIFKNIHFSYIENYCIIFVVFIGNSQDLIVLLFRIKAVLEIGTTPKGVYGKIGTFEVVKSF